MSPCHVLKNTFSPIISSLSSTVEPLNNGSTGIADCFFLEVFFIERYRYIISWYIGINTGELIIGVSTVSSYNYI